LQKLKPQSESLRTPNKENNMKKRIFRKISHPVTLRFLKKEYIKELFLGGILETLK